MKHSVLKTVLAVLLSVGAVGTSRADSFNFEDAIVTPSAQQISIVRLPVVSSTTGKVSYKNIEIRFSYVGGKLTFTSGYPKITSSPSVVTAGLSAGTYYEVGRCCYYVELSGPLAGLNGRTKWLLTDLYSGSVLEFHTGGTKGHPLEMRLTDAELNAPYTYGYANGNTYLMSTVKKDDLVGISPISTTSFSIYDYTTDGKDSGYQPKSYTLKKK